MERFVITSLRPNAGKTSVIIGMAKVLNKPIAYIKPLGERFLYRKKRLWDYDAALVTQIFAMEENPEDMSVGFHHSKLLYMLDERGTEDKIRELATTVGRGKELLFVECGKDMTYGASVHLDAISIAGLLDARLLVIASGEEDALFDDLIFLKKYVQMGQLRLAGVLINKVPSAEDFRTTRLPRIEQAGIKVLGIIPYYKELPAFTVGGLADRLFARVITGEAHLNRIAGPFFFGTVTVEASRKDPLFQEPGKVVVTSGDRTPMILAALEGDTAAVILTDHLLPAPEIISQAAQRGIPLLSLSGDTLEIAGQLQGLEALTTKDDANKIALCEQMVRTHCDLEALLRP